MYDNNAQAAKFSLSPKNIKSLNREFSFTVLFNQIQMYDNNAQAAKFSLSPKNIKSINGGFSWNVLINQIQMYDKMHKQQSSF